MISKKKGKEGWEKRRDGGSIQFVERLGHRMGHSFGDGEGFVDPLSIIVRAPAMVVERAARNKELEALGEHARPKLVHLIGSPALVDGARGAKAARAFAGAAPGRLTLGGLGLLSGQRRCLQGGLQLGAGVLLLEMDAERPARAVPAGAIAGGADPLAGDLGRGGGGGGEGGGGMQVQIVGQGQGGQEEPRVLAGRARERREIGPAIAGVRRGDGGEGSGEGGDGRQLVRAEGHGRVEVIGMGRGAAAQEAVAARAGAVEGGAVKGEGGGVGATQGGVRAIHEGGGRAGEGEVVVAGRRHQGELERHERRQHAVSVGVVVGERGRAPEALGAELQGGMVLGGGG